MNREKPSAGAAFSSSWNVYKDNFATLIGASALFLLLAGITQAFIISSGALLSHESQKASSNSVISVILLITMLILIVLYVAISMSFQQAMIRAVRRTYTKMTLLDFFTVTGTTFKGILTSIVSTLTSMIAAGVLVAIGSLFTDSAPVVSITFFILAFSVFLTLSFFLSYSTYYTLDRGDNPFTAMKKSCLDISSSTLFVLLILLCSACAIFVASSFVIPILFVIPLVQLWVAQSYVDISSYNTDVDTAENEVYAKNTQEVYGEGNSTEDSEFYGDGDISLDDSSTSDDGIPKEFKEIQRENHRRP